MQKVIVLGAKGRFGRAAVEAFNAAGWTVTAFGRSWIGQAAPGITRVTGDAADAAQLTNACAGHDVIVNAVNPPYERWAREMPSLTKSVIAAARSTDATVMIPGNVYNYGAGMPPVLTAQIPWAPTTRKGKLRVEMEHAFRNAGVRTVVLRAGDFIESEKTGNWFDSQIAAKSKVGRTLYPGPVDAVHAWAYLPDMARAMVGLAEIRDSFDPFEEFGFSGFGITGDTLIAEIARATGKPQKRARLPWPLLRILGFVMPQMREVYEMRYLWQVPHEIDGSKLSKALPDFQPTALKVAMKEVLC